ncbi:MAG: CocE/NonD family hydrolase [Proteobacteria bacterium]|nr:CocE/NonD family hydrolase [Pseudomonadota bacterium]MBI3499943.1 CocE/NonD family hydrolase [Pseudomonadota bacterium]
MASKKPTSRPSKPEFGVIVAHDVMVAMRDGVRLATDIYRPALADGAPAPGRFPTILTRTSYDKSNPVMQVEPVGMFFARRGYAVAIQDLRGRGHSEGTGEYSHTANPKEGLDGFDSIEWIARQAWSNGRVGMVGSSHSGIVQNVAALHRPPHLKALWVDVAPTSAFDWEARQGGAQSLHMFAALFLHGYDAQEIRDDKVAQRRIESAVENIRDELMKMPFKPGHSPLSVLPNFERVLAHYTYDGAHNEWWGMEAMEQKTRWKRFADIPAVFSSGWYDPFVADVTEQFQHLAKQNKATQRLIAGPWNHTAMRGGGTFVVEVDFGKDAAWGYGVYNAARLRWFDRWLKDLQTGVEKDPPVRFFVMGGGSGRRTEAGRIDHGGEWHRASAWPPPAKAQSWYLSSGGGLSTEPPGADEPSVSWTHDPENPVPTIGGAVSGFLEWVTLPDGMDKSYVSPRARMHSVVPDGPMHQRERQGHVGCRPPYPLLSERHDVLVFESPRLVEAVTVAGLIELQLWLSSSAPDTDVTAKLIDVCPANPDWPEGFHLPLADTILRLRFRQGFKREVLLEPGKPVRLTIKLPPIANQFAAGHRIRLDIASSNFPRFDVNPNTGEKLGRHTRMEKALNTLYLDKKRAAHLVLPVLAESKTRAG